MAALHFMAVGRNFVVMTKFAPSVGECRDIILVLAVQGEGTIREVTVAQQRLRVDGVSTTGHAQGWAGGVVVLLGGGLTEVDRSLEGEGTGNLPQGAGQEGVAIQGREVVCSLLVLAVVCLVATEVRVAVEGCKIWSHGAEHSTRTRPDNGWGQVWRRGGLAPPVS